MRGNHKMNISCWSYDQHLSFKSTLGNREIDQLTTLVKFEGLELRLKQSGQNRSTTPDVKVKRVPQRNVTPLGRR
ncbi:hypothetical protein pb186bvf_006212 [Paramecium bursaria]